MRIQILELPRKTVDDEIPFVIVFSEVPLALLDEADGQGRDEYARLKDKTGASAIFMTDDIVGLD